MPLPSGRGWELSEDYKTVALNTTKKKFVGITLTEKDIATIVEGAVGLETLEFVNCTFTGEARAISDIPAIAAAATLNTLVFDGCVGISGDIPATWSVCTRLAVISVKNCSYNAAAVDSFLIALNAARVAGLSSAAAISKVVDVSGTTSGKANGIRTSASNAANTALGGASWTVTQNT